MSERNLDKLEEICRKENKINNAKTLVILIFFVVAILVIALFLCSLSGQNPGEAVVKRLLISLIIFAVYIFFSIGYMFVLGGKFKKLEQERNELIKEEDNV